MKLLFALLIALLYPAVAAVAESGIDPSKLPGTYRLEVDGLVVDVDARKTYGPDGSYVSKGTGSIFGVGKKLSYRGTWKLEGREMVFLLTESSTPKQAPVGVPLRFFVESLTDSEMVLYDQERDKRYTEKRVEAAG